MPPGVDVEALKKGRSTLRRARGRDCGGEQATRRRASGETQWAAGRGSVRVVCMGAHEDCLPVLSSLTKRFTCGTSSAVPAGGGFVTTTETRPLMTK